jgi:integrase/recombinase XerD
MNEHVEQFIAYLMQERALTANTVSAYRTDLDQYVAFLRERKVSSVVAASREDVVAFMIFLRERKYSNATVARRTAAVKSFYAFLTSIQVVKTDPTTAVESPRVEREVPKALTPVQVDELMELPLRSRTADRMRDRAMFEVLYATGMRVSELVGLNIGDVNLKTKIVHCVGKAKKVRMIPLSESAVTAVEEYLDMARGQLVRDDARAEDVLFVNHRGGRLTRQGFWLILKQ